MKVSATTTIAALFAASAHGFSLTMMTGQSLSKAATGLLPLTPQGVMQSTPQYKIVDYYTGTVLSVNIIPPVFRCLENGSLIVDRTGQILFEWSPRDEDGMNK
jgi:hypothetical protein